MSVSAKKSASEGDAVTDVSSHTKQRITGKRELDDTTDNKDAKRLKEDVEEENKADIKKSKNLFVGNLSASAEKADLLNFFKDSEGFVSVRIGTKTSDTEAERVGHVKFSTAEAAEKALHTLNGKELLGCPVRLDVPNRKSSLTPHSVKKGESQVHTSCSDQQARDENAIITHGFENYGDHQARVGHTIFVHGLSKNDREQQAIMTLGDHFSSCGLITRLVVPKVKRGIRGIAYIDFKDSAAVGKALEYDGSELRGCTLKVEAAGGWTAGRSGGQDKSTEYSELHVDRSRPDGDDTDVKMTDVAPTKTNAGKEGSPIDKTDTDLKVADVAPKKAKKAKARKKGSPIDKIDTDLKVADVAPMKANAERKGFPIDKTPKIPATSKEQTTRSNTLFVGNLSPSVEKADVLNFFKSFGEVVDVRYVIEFATAEGAEKAFHELNSKELLGRPVRLELATSTPSNREKEMQPIQNGRTRGSRKFRVFISGFSRNDSQDQLRSALIDHFSSCGEICKCVVPSFPDGSLRGIAVIHFTSYAAVDRALQNNKSRFGQSTLSVWKKA